MGNSSCILVGQVAANDTIKENYPKVRKGGPLLDLRKPQRACALTSEKDDSPTEKSWWHKEVNGTRIRIRNGLAAQLCFQRKKLRGVETEKRQGPGGEGVRGVGQQGQRGGA